ncbi:right-handed parallel beta-helix repeat-containing protein [Geodermatophilus sp. URMC 61]|uniref:right-handed parallel beta-helix repeat-containing protein n=1 Tax=Geodermatophilus sp. URMC 61 TaxID=3423411 RepID=UPI00406CFCD1
MRRRGTGSRVLVALALTTAALAVPLLAGRLPHAEAPEEASTPSAGLLAAPSQAGADRQSDLVVAEDRRLLGLVTSVRPGSAPYTVAPEGADTLVLTSRGLPYGLGDLVGLGAARVEPDGAVLLTRHVFVAPGARLAIEAPGTELRLRSESSGFASLVAWKADLLLAGASGRRLQVTSWDPAAAGPDQQVEDGRAYVRDVGGRMTVRQTDAAHLGFWAGRTSGVAWTGSSTTVATGAISDSSFRANHYGVFASQGEQLEVVAAVFADNVVDGLALYRSTESTTVRESLARDNGRHGYSVDRGSESVVFTRSSAIRNGAHGVFFDGAPLAQGLSAGGAPLRAYGQVTVDGGSLVGNGRAGLRVMEGAAVTVRGTRVVDNRDGIVVVDTGAPTTVEDTVVSGPHRFGISVQGGTATVLRNEVVGGRTGIRAQDAVATITGNSVSGTTDHGVSVVGAAGGCAVTGNTIAGRGPSGLDTYRVDPLHTVDVRGNDLEGWETDRDNWTYWSTFIPNHPMLVLWVVVLGVPVTLALHARRRRLEPGAAPYPDVPRRGTPRLVRVDVGRPTSEGTPS